MDLSRDTTKPYLSGLPDKSDTYCCLEASLMHHMTLHIESWHKLPLKINCVREWAKLAGRPSAVVSLWEQCSPAS